MEVRSVAVSWVVEVLEGLWVLSTIVSCSCGEVFLECCCSFCVDGKIWKDVKIAYECKKGSVEDVALCSVAAFNELPVVTFL